MSLKFDEQSIKERAEKHQCDGMCYTSTSMCLYADTCEETRTGEALAAIIALLIIFIGIPLLLAGLILVMLYG